MQRIMNPYTVGRAQSLLREILSSTQVKLLELKGAQVQYTCKIVCVAGSEIDREASTKPRQSEFHCEHCRSHTEANVRHICEISGRTR